MMKRLPTAPEVEEDEEPTPLPGFDAYIKFITEQRIRKAYKRADFCKNYGIKEGNIRSVEEGRTPGSIKFVVRLAGIFGLRPGLLIDMLAGLDTGEQEAAASTVRVPPELTPDERGLVADFAALLLSRRVHKEYTSGTCNNIEGLTAPAEYITAVLHEKSLGQIASRSEPEPGPVPKPASRAAPTATHPK